MESLQSLWNQPKPKKPVTAEKNVQIPAEDGEENWENDLLEHSYNPLEVAIRYLTCAP